MKKFCIKFLGIFFVFVLCGLMPVRAESEERVPQKAEERTAVLYFDNIIKIKSANSFSTDIKVDPNGQSVNAVGIEILFSKNDLSVKKLDISDSFCELFIDNYYDNESGLIRISCGKPYPGIMASSVIAKIEFSVRRTGWQKLEFSDDSLVLANDGFGTDVLDSVENKSIYFK